MFTVELSHENIPVVWFKNDQRLHTSKVVSMTDDGKFHTLTIKDLTIDDTSQIRVEAMDKSSEAKLTVLGKNTQKNLHDVYIRRVLLMKNGDQKVLGLVLVCFGVFFWFGLNRHCDFWQFYNLFVFLGSPFPHSQRTIKITLKFHATVAKLSIRYLNGALKLLEHQNTVVSNISNMLNGFLDICCFLFLQQNCVIFIRTIFNPSCRA